MGLRRTQKEDYNLKHYIEEVDKGDAADPEVISYGDVQAALQNMVKGSDAVRKVQSTWAYSLTLIIMGLYFDLYFARHNRHSNFLQYAQKAEESH